MKRIIFALALFAMFPFTSQNFAYAENHNAKVEVVIQSNNEKPPLKIETDWKKGLTAMEALRFVSEVETHSVREHVFVTSINGLKGIPAQKVWYCEINGKPATQLAIHQLLKKGDMLTWIYKQDVCSAKKCKEKH